MPRVKQNPPPHQIVVEGKHAERVTPPKEETKEKEWNLFDWLFPGDKEKQE